VVQSFTARMPLMMHAAVLSTDVGSNAAA